MGQGFLDVVAASDAGDLLTTGEAAKLLGVSRQHIVDLCEAGDLPYTTIGKHRRVTRADVESIRTLRQRLTADQVRSLLLAHAVAGHLVADPDQVLNTARANLERMRAADRRGSAKVWLEEWRRLLDGPLPDVLNALTSRSLRSRELRQNTPFAGVLSVEERSKVLDTARRSRGKVFV